MNSPSKIKEIIFDDNFSFENKVQEVLAYQVSSVPVFREFAHSIGLDNVPQLSLFKLPFLPIGFFKTHNVLAEGQHGIQVFESSGTTGAINSRHLVADEELYHKSILNGFETFYGPVHDYCFFALLPSYLERGNSSLINMVNYLIEKSGGNYGGFYRYNYNQLHSDLLAYHKTGQARKVILIGVSFALWEMTEKITGLDLSSAILMETGGMKGKREEIIREELHQILNTAFRTGKVHSEYGMTELLSQAYSLGDGIFRCPPWMKVLVRDPYDPLAVRESGKGALNIIDLANLYSCSFIATNDLGEVYEDGSFSVMGRMDGSDLRGCNLMF